jgi:predicted lysophospholipase L1 biosynthesis ABC-type transport system permease subunit
MEFDLAKTAVAFVALIALGVGALLLAPVMAASTVLTMVLPAMVVFGLLCLALGVRYGEFRTSGR